MGGYHTDIGQKTIQKAKAHPVEGEGEKNHKKWGLNCVFGNFFFYVLDNCPQVQSLK